ncbi:MAG: metal-dependent transcriptional regulator [Candidatus Bathyarchaeota archaeon]|nr:metal-dependent transcriptional regulator [Candidatus Bathyarchaeota archaeon]
MRESVSGRIEDYLKAVYEVVEQKSYVRIKDISKELEVRPSTVVEMMRKLHGNGLVVYEKYGGITLTPRGREIAEAVKKRHDTFKKFLEIILVPEDIAAKDAHMLEHQLDPRTIRQFTRFVEFITQATATKHPKFIGRWIEQFRKYCEKKETGQ